MKGWITWVASICFMFVGSGMIYVGTKTPGYQEILVGMGLQSILFGGGLIGIGRKIEKAEVVTKEIAAAQTVVIGEKVTRVEMNTEIIARKIDSTVVPLAEAIVKFPSQTGPCEPVKPYDRPST